jgi:hypothetical protein
MITRELTLNKTRDYAQQVIRALHDAGWHIEAHGLSNDLYSISYQPPTTAWLAVFDSAERLAEQLEANDHAAPAFA